MLLCRRETRDLLYRRGGKDVSLIVQGEERVKSKRVIEVTMEYCRINTQMQTLVVSQSLSNQSLEERSGDEMAIRI